MPTMQTVPPVRRVVEVRAVEYEAGVAAVLWARLACGHDQRSLVPAEAEVPRSLRCEACGREGRS